MVDYAALSHLYSDRIDQPGYPLDMDFSEAEYELRLSRARQEMARADLDALVITSSGVGQWFTSTLEPHEWHDRCSSRVTFFILTRDGDYLSMTPTACGEHVNTTRRSVWVSNIRGIVEASEWPRAEIWDVRQLPGIFVDLGVSRGKLGFELGDCMTLGMAVHDFLTLRDLMPAARFVDASPSIRRLMSIHTPEEIERVRHACTAGIWIHDQVPRLLRPGMTERQFFAALTDTFSERYEAGYSYRADGNWEVRNPVGRDSNTYHAATTDRVFRSGDLVARGSSGVTYLGYPGDVDRLWYIGQPPEIVRHWHHTAWECNQAMAEQIRPGNLCSDIYAACARIEEKNGFPKRLVGRVGHGLRNTGGLSVHPDNHTVLEPGMIISVEPMFGNEYGWFDLEDQYVVTETGRQILNPIAPEELPLIEA